MCSSRVPQSESSKLRCSTLWSEAIPILALQSFHRPLQGLAQVLFLFQFRALCPSRILVRFPHRCSTLLSSDLPQFLHLCLILFLHLSRVRFLHLRLIQALFLYLRPLLYLFPLPLRSPLRYFLHLCRDQAQLQLLSTGASTFVPLLTASTAYRTCIYVVDAIPLILGS